ncbi:mitochondrial thiamine pyrophosphate carrier-like, partial [Hetaerina americana]
MIGYDPSSERKLKNTQHAVAGAVSGLLTRAICQPFDVLKIRFQLQWEPLSRNSPSPGLYTGVIQATKRICRDEGLKALWKGHVPAQYLSVVYGSAQFYSFQLLTHLWHKMIVPIFPSPWVNERSPVTHFSCGSLSGAIATLV